MENKKGFGFWVLIIVSIVLVVFLIIGQTLSLIDYDLALSLGLQESEKEIGKVGIAFAKGFAFGDTIFYVPLLVFGILGLLKGKKWGTFLMLGALGISVYWPIVHLYAIYIDTEAITLDPEKYISFPIVLSLITIYGFWGSYYLYKNSGD
ncbi:hypothetical protein [uncultured Eudoraea sp.]|uniref:hypothetical protein n=1 Tax=uncultured Eudoraea sp. TaxID=1035614 RepID=UPI002621831B|nr:hypothetical protein [uncultured Eudoraea sp.]